MNLNGTSSKDKIHFFITLTSGYKVVPIYERKGTFEPLHWGWGHDGIPINGSITNVSLNKTSLFNQVILVDAFEEDKEIYKKFVTTDENGTFHASFFPPTSGSIKVSAMIPNENSTESIITVIVTESALPIMVIALLIILAITLIIITKTLWDTNKNAKKVMLLPIGFLTIAAYIILYKFPPFDSAGNAAFAAALLAPMATYVYDVIK